MIWWQFPGSLTLSFAFDFGFAAGLDDSGAVAAGHAAPVAVVAGAGGVGSVVSGGCESVLVAITRYVRMWSVIACDMVVAATGFQAPSAWILGLARSRWSIILSELVSARSSGV